MKLTLHSLQCCLNKLRIDFERYVRRSSLSFDVSDIPAQDNSWEGDLITGFNAGANMPRWSLVYLTAGGLWQLADADGSGTYPARGILVEAGVNGSPAKVLVRGVVRNDVWTWTASANLYLSTTAGAATQTAPSASGTRVQALGFAVSSSSVLFNFQPYFFTNP